ncbi:MAG: HD domain-containing protein [Firmicutes bacterium]|nr:HD domain-containing protein [Bacillota bacterium]
MNLETAKSFVNTFPRDLQVHSYNVCNIATGIARYSGYREDQIYILSIGSLIHDVGKCCIDPGIINKPGKLTEKEFELVKQHTFLGADMIRQYDDSHKYEPIILYHHERWDGKGYYGLFQEEIPAFAQIVSIADAFDAMTSIRPYQMPKSLTGALRELSNSRGTQFAPELVDIFEKYILDSLKFKENYIR